VKVIATIRRRSKKTASEKKNTALDQTKGKQKDLENSLGEEKLTKVMTTSKEGPVTTT